MREDKCMKINWLGHSCFKLISKDGLLIFDPYKDGSVPGLKSLKEECDVVLCSHNHDDHHGTECINLTGNSSCFKISFIDSYHDNENGKLRGCNKIYVVETENMKVVHLGDIGCELDVTCIHGCDVLLIPIGGYYTIDTKMAIKLIDSIEPRIVIPMHYKLNEIGYDVLNSRDEFIKESKNVIIYDSNEIEITKDTPNQTAILNL